MEDTGPVLIATGTAALLFAAMFVFGRRIQLLGALGFRQRSVISFSAGMAAAYVFVHVVPRPGANRRTRARRRSNPTTGRRLPAARPKSRRGTSR